jgi:transglutaminase-like putative cysteine protease
MRQPLGLPGDDHYEQLTLPGSVDAAEVDWSGVRRSAYLIHQRISYRYEGPVRKLRQRLVVQPRELHGDQRRLDQRLRVLHALPQRVTDTVDLFGNHVVDIDIPRVSEEVTFLSWSIVERDADHGLHLTSRQGLHHPSLLTPTRLTSADRTLRELAGEMAATGLQGADLCDAVAERVHREMTYQFGATGVQTTAAQAFALRRGVCQDFAHVMLALTRELGLACRYVSGQLIGTGGSHAWVEVLVPRNRTFAEVISLDPTQNRRTDMTYLTVAVGRDYSDVAPFSGTYRAPYAGRLSTSKRVSVVSLDGEPPLAPTG